MEHEVIPDRIEAVTIQIIAAALIIAGLLAKGTTQVNRIYYLDCGCDWMEKLRNFSAQIQRIQEA